MKKRQRVDPSADKVPVSGPLMVGGAKKSSAGTFFPNKIPYSWWSAIWFSAETEVKL